ncbi:signal peptidase II [Candidatus Poribacteria bacterium]|nr:signal peptidase II [Candidatus Poribacteria bacterium]
MFLLIISSLVILLDQGSKYYIKNTMFLGESIPIITNIFHITFIYNSGGAFGLFQEKTMFFIIATSIAIVTLLIFYYLSPNNNVLLKTALALILGGAIGNLIDRVLYKEVVDFFDFRIWPIFNIADIAICCGMGLLILEIYFDEKKKKENSHHEHNNIQEKEETIEG